MNKKKDNNRLFLKEIEFILRFSLSKELIKEVENDFVWLKQRFNLIDEKIYKKTKITSYPNIKYKVTLLKEKPIKEIKKNTILKIANKNTINDYVTYPKKD